MSAKLPLSEADRAALVWHKALASTVNGQCVEVAAAAGIIAVRDSKDPAGPVLLYTPAEFSAFLEGARNGEFDHFVQ